jgi:hypothetical protein
MSEILDEAAKTISAAEAKLRGIMQTALSKQRYSDVARLATLADGLLNIAKMARNGDAVLPSTTGLPQAPQPEHQLSRRRTTSLSSRSSDTAYPRFERQGDRLVKIAWSKKDRREYEHRAPVEVILRIAELFERDRAHGPFMMDALMPFKAHNDDDIPSYQAYLALAWFRSLGAVEPRGKDGYAVIVDDLRSHVENAWQNLPDALRR